MFDDLTRIVRTYTRAFVSQSVGVIGLLWCLVENQAGFAVLLTLLVLTDQAIFLRGRFNDAEPAVPYRRLLDGWCLALSGFDLLLCCAALMRRAGLRDGPGGPPADGPLDCVAYVLAAFAHGPTNLVAATAAGRLLAAGLATLGAVAFLAGLAAVIGFRRAG